MLHETGAMEALTVGQVAQTFGVTVRTLHHYDEIGLLHPSERSHAGYRRYTGADLQRLGTIVVYRRLGFPLAEIDAVLAADDADVVDHLRRQRDLVRDRLAQMTELVDAIEHALEAQMNERPATTEDLKQLLGDGYNEDHQAEAEQRWGDTDAWAQSSRRTARMTRDDWAKVMADTKDLEAAIGADVRDGEPADGARVGELAEWHRASIKVFYDCDHAFQVGLAQMYLSDPRFTQHYEDLAPGAAQWLHDAIVANAG